MAAVIVFFNQYLNRSIKGLQNISGLTRKYKLYFSKYDVLESKIIGLDGLKRKLLFLKQKDHKTYGCIIDLREVKACTIRKIYSSIEAGGLKKRKLEEYLHTISLCFRYKNGEKRIALPFYETHSNAICDIPEMESKVKDWAAVLSQMLPVAITERA